MFCINVIKNIADLIAQVLGLITNLNFSYGILPKKWKLSSVVPIWKKTTQIIWTI